MSTTPETRAQPAPLVSDALHAALATGERPPRPSALSACLTFGWRGMLKIKHVPEQLIDVSLTPVLFLLMFTYLFGGAVAGRPRSTCSTSSPACWCSPCCSRPSTRACR